MNLVTQVVKLRKIIHVDMDCFYAAIEIRDNPFLKNRPIAVGGLPERRGVICTCNYLARQFGVRAAMPTATAYRHCPDLTVVPVNMPKYREVAHRIQGIFNEFTDLVEPLALDEAYLDVSSAQHCRGSATWMAQAIRKKIWETEELIASAGVAPNKFLAKIASGWNKPNGLLVIRPQDISNFVTSLPVNKLFGVGKITAEKLHSLGLQTCTDLQQVSLEVLTQHFGKFGLRLYQQCRGIDERDVEPNKLRKSLSIETTFTHDLQDIESNIVAVNELYEKLNQRLLKYAAKFVIKNQFVKLKFNNFKSVTAEAMSHKINLDKYLSLIRELYYRENRPIRLLGLGVHFDHSNINNNNVCLQQSLWPLTRC